MLLRGLIGMVLRKIRLGQGRTLRDVAEVARVSVPYLSEVERGRKEPSSELLAAICTALDLQLADLLDEVRFEIGRAQLSELSVRHGFTGRSITSTTSIRADSIQIDSVQGQPMAPASLPGQVSLISSMVAA